MGTSVVRNNHSGGNILYGGIGGWRRYAVRGMYLIPTYADIRRCVDTRKMGVAILRYRTPPYPIEGIYLST